MFIMRVLNRHTHKSFIFTTKDKEEMFERLRVRGNTKLTKALRDCPGEDAWTFTQLYSGDTLSCIPQERALMQEYNSIEDGYNYETVSL